jgi:GNAT superfamily N-acetyltransferase
VVEVRIELLSADSPTIDTVLSWHWHEWSDGAEDANRDEWRSRLQSRANHDRVPFTLVAHLDGEPVGCLSVCEDDRDDRFAGQGPWLSGMFVVGRARNLGVGRALVRTVEEKARTFGARELWLYTAEAGPFYERCGWSYQLRKEHPRDNSVMRHEL